MLNTNQMQHAISVKANAEKLKRELDTFVLLKRDSVCKEVIALGEPDQFNRASYFRIETPIPEAARLYVFRLWQRETTLNYNALVRELNQLGVQHELRLRDVQGATP